MDNVSAGEILVILLVALIVLGPTKLPHTVKQVGRFIGEVRRIGVNFRRELTDAMEEPIRQSQAVLTSVDPRNIVTQATTATEVTTTREFNSSRSSTKTPTTTSRNDIDPLAAVTTSDGDVAADSPGEADSPSEDV